MPLTRTYVHTHSFIPAPFLSSLPPSLSVCVCMYVCVCVSRSRSPTYSIHTSLPFPSHMPMSHGAFPPTHAHLPSKPRREAHTPTPTDTCQPPHTVRHSHTPSAAALPRSRQPTTGKKNTKKQKKAPKSKLTVHQHEVARNPSTQSIN